MGREKCLEDDKGEIRVYPKVFKEAECEDLQGLRSDLLCFIIKILKSAFVIFRASDF
jgi:hypothetical protein